MTSRPRALAFTALVALAPIGAASCGGMATPKDPNAPDPGATIVDADGDGLADNALAENPFLPENQNLSDCVSSLPRPDCGSEAKGGAGQYLTFGALMLGMALIGWRIARAVRRRDRERDRAAEVNAAS